MVYDLEPIEESDLDLESRFGVKNTHEKETLRPQEKDDTPEARVEGAVEHAQVEHDATYHKTLRRVQGDDQSTTVHTSTLAQDASTVHQQVNRESQVQHLLDLAMTKGVVHAVKVAEHTQDYYILDRVHDQLLTDDFRSALRDRDMLT